MDVNRLVRATNALMKVARDESANYLSSDVIKALLLRQDKGYYEALTPQARRNIDSIISTKTTTTPIILKVPIVQMIIKYIYYGKIPTETDRRFMATKGITI